MAKDYFGFSISAGDYVAVAFRRGNWCEIRFGKIIEFFEGSVYNYTERRNEMVKDAKMRLAWLDDNTKTWAISNGRVDVDSSRLIKMELPEGVPSFA